MRRINLVLKGERFSADYLRRLEAFGIRVTLIFVTSNPTVLTVTK